VKYNEKTTENHVSEEQGFNESNEENPERGKGDH